MIEELSKAKPLRARYVSVAGPLMVQLDPKDFVEHVAHKPFTVIRGTWWGVFRRAGYLYVAAGEPILYCTCAKEELPGVQVDIVANVISSGPGLLDEK